MSHIKKDRYVKGTHNAISDYSGQKYKRKDMKLTWDGYLVGADEWEEKHPQLDIRVPPEDISIKDQTRTQNVPTNLLAPPYDPTGSV